MRKKAKVLALAGALTISIGGYFVYAAEIANAPGSVMNSKLSGTSEFWPLKNAWSWTVTPPPDFDNHKKLGLLIREKSHVLPAHTSPAIGPSSIIAAKDADREFGPGWAMADHTTWGKASLQLFSLDDIGATSAHPDQPLKVLATFRVGGAEVHLGGDETYLNGNQFAGYDTESDGKWNNNEIHLMNFYTQSKTTDQDKTNYWEYDVFLVCKSRY
jgi:hypothetical protein